MSAFRVGIGYDLHRLVSLPTGGGAGESGGGSGTGGGTSGGGGGGGQPVRPLVVGGVRLTEPGVMGAPCGVIAHSDGDVLLHAVTDAILGAMSLPDIGQLFPDSAAENAGRSSDVFVREAARRIRESGWKVVNIDAVVILERPRIGAHKAAMRAHIARLLNIPEDRVNVKGKSHERVDAVGEGRAIEAHVVALLSGT